MYSSSLFVPLLSCFVVVCFRRVLGRGVEVVQPNSPCSSLDRISSTQYSGKTAPDPVSILALALHPRALRLPIVHFFVPPLRRRTRESKSRQSRSAVAPRAPFLWAENLGRFFTIGIKIYRYRSWLLPTSWTRSSCP